MPISVWIKAYVICYKLAKKFSKISVTVFCEWLLMMISQRVSCASAQYIRVTFKIK